MKSTYCIIFFASILASVAGHGWIATIAVADKTYTGNPPMESQPEGKPSIIRQIQDNLPVTNLTLDELICGRGATARCFGCLHQVWRHHIRTRWFKISEQGTQSNGNWMQEQLYNGLPVNVTIPANLKAGNYLLRHEVIALHMAQSLGAAELFPGCVQLTVTGNGTIELTGNDFANFPGAYKPKDPGILVDVYTNFQGDKYQFPGPPVMAFV
ncbi:glycoside hydrolase family 61 protein F [Mycena olivaceomarginata]|nr:glycoside hydrolase family 61 protein F [Mycena olivaceomarginata]